MRESPYLHYGNQALSLTDHLAIDRTILANERTLLAYLRTALGLIVIGATFLHFLQDRWTDGAGYAFIALGGVMVVVGGVQFFRVKRRLGNLGTAVDDDPHQASGTRDRGE